MNAVMDINVWVSGLINRHGMPARVLDAYRDLRFTVVTSGPLLEELRRFSDGPSSCGNTARRDG